MSINFVGYDIFLYYICNMKESNNKKYVWLKERDYVSKFRWFYKLMYYLGCLEMKKWKKFHNSKQVYMGGAYYSIWGFRFWNPITWLFIVFLFLGSLLSNIVIAFGKTLEDILYFNRQKVLVDKILIKNKDYEEK